MNKFNKRSIIFIIILVLLVLAIALVIANFKVPVDKDSSTIVNGLTNIEKGEAYLASIWGDDYEKYIGEFIYKSPWANIDLSPICPSNERELTLISLVVFNFNPALLLDDEEVNIKIGDSGIDLKQVKERYTQIRFYDIGDEIKITGYRNDERFILYISKGEL